MKRIRSLALLSAFVAMSGASAYAETDANVGSRNASRAFSQEQTSQRMTHRHHDAESVHSALSPDELRAARKKHHARQKARQDKLRDRTHE